MQRLSLTRTLWSVLAVGLVAALAYGAGKTRTPAVPKVIRAQSFEVVDAHNRVRAHLRTDKDGTTQLELLNDRGHPQVSLSLAKDDAPDVKLFDEHQNLRASLYLSPKADVGLVLCNSHGIFRLGASVLPNNCALLGLGDSTKKGGSCLYSYESGGMGLELGSLQEKGAVTFRVSPQGVPQAALNDHGKVLWSVPADLGK